MYLHHSWALPVLSPFAQEDPLKEEVINFIYFFSSVYYLQACAVDKYNTGLIALELMTCLYVWRLSAWLVKCTLLQYVASLTLVHGLQLLLQDVIPGPLCSRGCGKYNLLSQWRKLSL